jgi:hypothetical protein
MTFLKGWKTIGVNVALLVAGALQQAAWPDLVPAQYVGVAVAVIAAVNLFLRTITNTAVGKSS